MGPVIFYARRGRWRTRTPKPSNSTVLPDLVPSSSSTFPPGIVTLFVSSVWLMAKSSAPDFPERMEISTPAGGSTAGRIEAVTEQLVRLLPPAKRGLKAQDAVA